MKKEVIVIEEYRSKDFAERLETHINNGWSPHGDPIILPVPDKTYDEHVYFQVMIREKETDDVPF